jgi:glutaredoxin-related protein
MTEFSVSQDKGSAIIFLVDDGIHAVTEYKNQWIRYLLKQAGYSTVPQVWTHEGQYLGGYEGVQKHDIQTV